MREATVGPTRPGQLTKLLSGAWEVARIVELSHSLQEGMPTYPTHAKYFQNAWLAMGDPARMNQLVLSEHTGTHVDAPVHFAATDDSSAPSIDQISLERFGGSGRCIHLATPDQPNWKLGAKEILAWEQTAGPLRAGEVVLFDFGWSKRWALGREGFSYLNGWPGLGLDAAELLAERQLRGVGTDCVGLDPGDGGDDLGAHRTLLQQGILIYENLANLDLLEGEFFFLGIPLRIANGTGSPVRALALI